MTIVNRSKAFLHDVFDATTSWFGSKTYSLPGVLWRLPHTIQSFVHGTDFATAKNQLFCSDGYHRFNHHDLSASEARKYIHYVASTCAVHAGHSEWVEPLGFHPVDIPDFPVDFEGGLQKNGVVWFDKETGLKVILYQNEDELLITFGALNSHDSEFAQEQKGERDALTATMKKRAILSLLGTCPAMYEKAEYFVQKLIDSNQFSSKKITLCGMCLGGSVASYVALRLQCRAVCKAVCMNSFPLGAGLLKKIGRKNLGQADSVVTHISSKGDYFSNLWFPFAIVDLFFNTLGLKTPGNFGKRYDVQAIHHKPARNHQDILGAMLATCLSEHKAFFIRAGEKSGFEERKHIRQMLKSL